MILSIEQLQIGFFLQKNFFPFIKNCASFSKVQKKNYEFRDEKYIFINFMLIFLGLHLYFQFFSLHAFFCHLRGTHEAIPNRTSTLWNRVELQHFWVFKMSMFLSLYRVERPHFEIFPKCGSSTRYIDKNCVLATTEFYSSYRVVLPMFA